MIPQIQLKKINPLSDQLKRKRMVKKKQNKHNARKKHLTKRKRQWAGGGTGKDYKGPLGKRSYGNLPMSKRHENE